MKYETPLLHGVRLAYLRFGWDNGQNSIPVVLAPGEIYQLGKQLDFLRSRGEWSDLSPAETHQQLLKHFQSPQTFERLVAIAHTEPPRGNVGRTRTGIRLLS
ncbi:hypothetical protein GSN00_03120 [Cylindrospermopsis raciborskii CHAB3438]|uniref:hypothetical protein n=1 Tax=Cylindrospermopsis TaxID=77021 RepID=UPI00128F605C|nr:MULTISPECIES: hypothetical protein [Cylindrospermopsis]MBU6345332.1 hypothetical protein [Cyanobacteria bacterium REEB494]MCH4903391.1 hypothetical protein [Cylindrospermopsis raciborskii CHAB3438]